MAEEEKAYRAAKAKRTQIKAACTRAKSFIDELGEKEVTVMELQQRQAKIRESWQAFEDAQAQIELMETTDEQAIIHERERQTFEEKYFAVDAKFEEIIVSHRMQAGRYGPNPFESFVQQENRVGMPQPGAQMRLPRIELPTFTGSYDEWRPFHDSFHSMIHENPALPTIQKMHYLKASLKGEAADVISDLKLSTENYIEAWAMLKERYSNERVIVQKHIKSILDQPVMHKENQVELRQLVNTVSKHLRALKVLKRCTDKWDDLLVHIITSKLAPITAKEWENNLKNSDVPTFKELTDFLSNRCRTLEAIDRRPQESSSKATVKRCTSAHVVTDKSACKICKGDHPIFRCGKFLELPTDKRVQEIRELKLCLNCLKSTDHRARSCTGGSCRRCGKRHNTLLHRDENSQPRDSEANSKKSPETTSADSHAETRIVSTNVNHAAYASGQRYLLSTAIVHVRDVKGNLHECRALLDCGSQSSFITSDLVAKLKVKEFSTRVPINGVGNSSSETRSFVKVNVQSRFNGFKAELSCLVLDKITQDIPTVSINRADVRIPPGIALADPKFMESAKIDMLIGVEIFWDIMCVGQFKATEA